MHEGVNSQLPTYFAEPTPNSAPTPNPVSYHQDLLGSWKLVERQPLGVDVDSSRDYPSFPQASRAVRRPVSA